MLDGTAVAAERLDSTIASITGDDPNEIRWGFQAIIRNKGLQFHECGKSSLKFAEFDPIQSFAVPEEVHTMDENMPREQRVQHTALEAQYALTAQFAGTDHRGNRDAQKPDMGFRVGFLGEKDPAKMKVLSERLLPSLPRIHEIAKMYEMPSPIEAVCPGQDDIGETRLSCATCWQQWIVSPLARQYVLDAAISDHQVYYEDKPDEIVTVRISEAEAQTALDMAIDSLKTSVPYLQNQWRTIVAEFEKGIRKDLDENNFQHSIRKDLHQAKPEDRQIRMLQAATQSAQASGNNDALLGTALQILDRMDKRLSAIEAPIETSPAPTNVEFSNGQNVTIDGEQGTVTEQPNPQGWYGVTMENGEVKKARKNQFETGV